MAKRPVIRVGIIGQGRSGYSIHAAHFSKDRKYKLVAVCDLLADRREQAEREFGCDSYEDHRQLLARDDVDLVVNSTPSYLHVPVTRDALRAGKHVVCEKPLARRARDVDRLIAEAAKADRVFTIYQQSRYAPYFQQVQKVLNSGVLGRIVLIKIAFNGFARRWDWQTLQECGGGNLLNTGPHPLDQALQLFGEGMPKVHCVMDRANTFGDAEDFVKLLLTGEGRPTIDLEISSCDAYPLYTYHLHGTRGGLTGNTTELKWRFYRPHRAPKQKLVREPLEDRVYCREDLPFEERSWTVPKSKRSLFPTMSAAYYRDLYKTLVEGAPLVITPEQVRTQIAVIEKAHRQNPLSRLS